MTQTFNVREDSPLNEDKVLKVNFKEHSCENQKYRCFTNHSGLLFYVEKDKWFPVWRRIDRCIVCGEDYGQ